MEQTDKKSKSIYSCAIAVAVFFVFTFLFYGPLGLYLENAEELWFSLKDTLLVVGVVSVAVFLFIMIYVGLLPEKTLAFFTKLLFGITLGLYVQGTLMNTNYGGVLNGAAIEWEKYTVYGICTLLVWVVCLILPFVLSKIIKTKADKVIMIAALFLTAVQLPALVVEWINYTPSSQKDFIVSVDGEFDFAEKENIVIIAVDTLDEAYYKEFIDAHPKYTDNLKGFVHYDNTLASGAYTIIGVPSMLTGVPYKHESTYTQYIEKIWNSDNPVKHLNDAGYDIRIFTEETFFSPATMKYVSNFQPSSGKVGSYFTLAKKLYKLASFKFSQHFLKRFFWMDTAEFTEAQGSDERYKTNDGIFYTNYQKSGITISKQYKKAFRYYLLNGVHSPYRLTADGVYGSATTSRQEQVEGVFTIIGNILADMKTKGIYDSSTIIITCDHGQKHVGEHSCFLYKAPFCSEAYSTSHAPVSVFDLPVLLDLIAGGAKSANEYGTDFLVLEEDDQRERHFFQNAKGTSKIEIDEYVTVSYAGDYDAMKLVSTHEDKNDANTPYVFGTELLFNRDATGNRYAFEGFGNNTGYRSILYGPYANLIIPIADIPKEGQLLVHFGLHSSSVKGTKYLITANGAEVANGTVDKALISSGLQFEVPVNLFKEDNKLEIEFNFPEVPEDEMEKEVNSRTETISLTDMTISIAD